MNAARVASATDDLHHRLSAWAHEARPARFIVRRLLPESNRITIDIVGAQPSSVDRFVVALGPAAAITATAGTLSRTQAEKTVHSLEDLQLWMRHTASVYNL